MRNFLLTLENCKVLDSLTFSQCFRMSLGGSAFHKKAMTELFLALKDNCSITRLGLRIGVEKSSHEFVLRRAREGAAFSGSEQCSEVADNR